MAKRELSKSYLEERYIRQGKTRYEISGETGVSPERIGSLLQQYGIKRHSVKRHGLSSHPLNHIWLGIKERCQNPNADNYKWYGAKGIKVCEEWQSFMPFYKWAIKNGWTSGLTVDRIDGSKDYCPSNCRLITVKEQCRNRKSNVNITVDGITHLQCEWEDILGLKPKIISKWKHRHGIEYVINRLRQEVSNAK